MNIDSLWELISQVKSLINDDGRAFTDYEIGLQLIQNRTYQSKLELTRLSDTMYQASVKYWDDSVVLSNWAGETVIPNDKQLIAGYFGLAEPESALYATGWTYDVYFAAAELLTIWAGQLEGEIESFSSDGSSYKFASGIQSKLKLAEEYKRKSYQFGAIKTAKMVRNDTTY